MDGKCYSARRARTAHPCQPRQGTQVCQGALNCDSVTNSLLVMLLMAERTELSCDYSSVLTHDRPLSSACAWIASAESLINLPAAVENVQNWRSDTQKFIRIIYYWKEGGGRSQLWMIVVSVKESFANFIYFEVTEFKDSSVHKVAFVAKIKGYLSDLWSERTTRVLQSELQL